MGEPLSNPIPNSNATSEDGQPRTFPEKFETLLRMDPENSVLQILKSQTSQKNLDPWETCSGYILKLEKELFEVRANLLTFQSSSHNPSSLQTIESNPGSLNCAGSLTPINTSEDNVSNSTGQKFVAQEKLQQSLLDSQKEVQIC